MQPNYELLKDAYAIVGGIPEERFNLSVIMQQKQSCGSIGCAFGWLGLHPQFAPLMSVSGSDHHKWEVNGLDFDFYADAAAELFSIHRHEAKHLFAPVGGSIYDRNIGGVGHRDRFLLRVQAYLKEKGEWRGLEGQEKPC